jgi:hypothetical protein
MFRRLVPILLAGALATAIGVPAHATTHADPNDVPGDRYDLASASFTIGRSPGDHRTTVTIRTYRGFTMRLGEGAFEVWLDTWGAGKADFRIKVFGDSASGGLLVAPIRSLHGPWYGYADVEKVGAKTVQVRFPTGWVHPGKQVRWHVRSSVPAFVTPDVTPVYDRAPDAGRFLA